MNAVYSAFDEHSVTKIRLNKNILFNNQNALLSCARVIKRIEYIISVHENDVYISQI